MPNINNNSRYNLRPRLSTVNYQTGVTRRRQNKISKRTSSSGSWEREVGDFADVTRDDTGKLTFQVRWKNGTNSTHEATELYKKCPQKVLNYYHQNLNVIQAEDNLLSSQETGRTSAQ